MGAAASSKMFRIDAAALSGEIEKSFVSVEIAYPFEIGVFLKIKKNKFAHEVNKKCANKLQK